ARGSPLNIAVFLTWGAAINIPIAFLAVVPGVSGYFRRDALIQITRLLKTLLVLLAMVLAHANPFLAALHIPNLDVGLRLRVRIDQVTTAHTTVNAHGFASLTGPAGSSLRSLGRIITSPARPLRKSREQ